MLWLLDCWRPAREIRKEPNPLKRAKHQSPLKATMWTGKGEFYLEYPALVSNQKSRFAVQLTRLTDFKAVKDATCEVRLARDTASEGFPCDASTQLDENLAIVETPADDRVLLEEIKSCCTLGMLLCLYRPHRLAYVLGDIMELDHAEAAARSISHLPHTARELSRARAELVAFLRAKCGLFDAENHCRCRRRVRHAVDSGRIDPARPLFALDIAKARGFSGILTQIRRLEHDQRAAAL